VLVAHNLRFDRQFLDAEFARVTDKWPVHPGVCTLEFAYLFDRGEASRRLEDCCDRHGIQLDSAHTALCDARATAALFIAYCEVAARAAAAVRFVPRRFSFVLTRAPAHPHPAMAPALAFRRPV
jgi:DNA polymerase-3 subunit epsilon